MFSKIERIIIKNARNIEFVVVNNDKSIRLKGDHISTKSSMHGVKKNKKNGNLELDFSSFKNQSNTKDIFYLDYRCVSDLIFSNSFYISLSNLNTLDSISNIYIKNSDLEFRKTFKKELFVHGDELSNVRFVDFLISDLKLNLKKRSSSFFVNGLVFNSELSFTDFSGIKNMSYAFFINVNQLHCKQNAIFRMNVANLVNLQIRDIADGVFYGEPIIKQSSTIREYYAIDRFEILNLICSTSPIENKGVSINKTKMSNYYTLISLKSILNENSLTSFNIEIEEALLKFHDDKFTMDSLLILSANNYKAKNESLFFKDIIHSIDEQLVIYSAEIDRLDKYDLHSIKRLKEEFTEIMKVSILNISLFKELFNIGQTDREFELIQKYYESKKDEFIRLMDDSIIKNNQKKESDELIKKEHDDLISIVNIENPTDNITSENRDYFIHLLNKYHDKINDKLTDIGKKNIKKLVIFFNVKKKAVDF